MRNLILALVALAGLAAAGLLMFGGLGMSAADGSLAAVPPGPTAALTKPKDTQPKDAAASPAPKQSPAKLVGDVHEHGVAEAAVPTGPRTVDGVIEDRFGQAVRGERVWLIDGTAGHPPASAAYADYTTAMTSSSGKFSLTLPVEGEFRLAVGPPGQPRVPVSSTQSNAGRPRARVVVPGGTTMCVIFDEVPAADEVLTLELVTLREGETEGDGGRGDRGDRGDRGGRGRDRGTRDNGLDGPRSGGEDYDGSNNNNEGAGQRRGPGGRQGSLEAPAAQLASFTQDGERQRGGGQRGGGQEGGAEGGDLTRGRGGFRNLSEEERESLREQLRERMGTRGEGDEFNLPEPAREVWRSAERHEISEEELLSGVVVLSGALSDRVARLDLRVGRRRVIEGVARFTIIPDVALEIRVLPVDLSAEEPALNYIVSSQPLGPTAPAIGIQWEQ
ncbi:MAG: hypothetical protein O2816_11535 [Planctomycetota bacterium]|nr:hypothetical protein [Planctomycetota bacterium]